MRIVAGLAKGRRLAAPATGTRPTSDRAREAMFNTLDSRMLLEGARVLDLYAGTGAVGLEALSRGASTAVFVENSRQALDVLRKNISTVGLPGAVVDERAVAFVLGGGPDQPFDLVFADPPYAESAHGIEQLLLVLSTEGWLTPQAFVVVERSARTPVGNPVSSITPVVEKRYGDSVLWYGRRR